jgi:hypothetical protein
MSQETLSRKLTAFQEQGLSGVLPIFKRLPQVFLHLNASIGFEGDSFFFQ